MHRLILSLLTLAALAACGGYQLAPWTRPGGFYQDESETVATEPQDGGDASTPEETPEEEEPEPEPADDGEAPNDAGAG